MNDTIQDKSTNPDRTEQILRCVHCNSELLIQSASIDQEIRCSVCSKIQNSTAGPPARNFRGVSRLTQGDYQIAWRSLLLGVLSVVLIPTSILGWLVFGLRAPLGAGIIFSVTSLLMIFATGIPGIYLGIRSFLKMKYAKPTSGEYRAALVGTGLNAIVGIPAGGVYAAFASIAFLIVFAPQIGEGPAESQAIMDAKFKIELVEHLKPYEAVKVLDQQTEVSFSDEPLNSGEKRHVAMWIIQATEQMLTSTPTIVQRKILTQSLHRKHETELIETKELTWKIAGEKRTVELRQLRIVSDGTDGPQQHGVIIRYDTVFVKDTQIVAIAISFENPPHDYSNDEIRKMFESFESIR